MAFTVHHLPRHAQRINEHLQAIKGPGAARFAQAASKVLIDGNRADRLARLDRHGRIMPSRKRPNPPGRRGPVMSPRYTKSYTIANYFAKITRKAVGWVLVAGVRDAEWLGHHAAGRVRGAPVRDVLGTTPKVHAALRRLFREFAQGQFKARGYRG
jgi:hypothetical protein